MAKEEIITVSGEVLDMLPNATFKVALHDENGNILEMTVIAHASGNIRRNKIKVVPGDIVDMEISPYDLTKARLVYRKR